jgi:hypothetical protein
LKMSQVPTVGVSSKLKRHAEISPSSEVSKQKYRKEKNNSKSSANFHTPASTSTPLVTPGTERPPRYESSTFSEDKTLHTSMNELPKVTPPHRRSIHLLADSLDRIIIEIHKKDNLVFDGPLTRETITLIWTHHLERAASEVRVMSTERVAGRFLRVIYKLKEETTINTITNTFNTEIEIKLGSKTHVFQARFPQFKDLTCELGKTTTVTFYKIPHELDVEDLRQWLNLFGEIKGQFRYLNSTLPYLVSRSLLSVTHFGFLVTVQITF